MLMSGLPSMSLPSCRGWSTAWRVGVAVLVGMLALPAGAQSQPPELHFRDAEAASGGTGRVLLGPQVLSGNSASVCPPRHRRPTKRWGPTAL
jgi:hypothetical protein